MKKNRLLLCMFMGVFSMIFAQQESQFTQYMYNTLAVNPGYAGSRNVGTFFGLHRSQWIGIDGAPKTSILSYHAPIRKKNLGLGLTLNHELIGPVTTTFATGDISYTLDFENSKLAFGIKGSLGFYNVDNSKLTFKTPNDRVFYNDNKAVFSPNIGAGLYWYTDNYYLGLSVPNLLQSDVYKSNNEGREYAISVVRNRQHFHLMGGYVFNINNNIKFKPAVLSKIVQGAPLQLDVSANFMFNEKFVLGAAWRWSAAVSGLAGFQINSNWFIGYAYDYSTTELNNYNSGSHEIFLRYELFQARKKIISPRFF